MKLLTRLNGRLADWQTAGLRSPQAVAALGLVVLAQLGAVASAVAGLVWLFAASVLLGIVVDQLAERNDGVQALLDRARFGLITRTMLREFAFVVLLARLAWPDPSVLLVATLTIVLILARVAAVASDQELAGLQTPKVSTRNLAGGDPADPVLRPLGAPLVLVTMTPQLAGIIGVYAGSVWPYVITAAGVALAITGWTLWRLTALLRHRRGSDAKLVLQRTAEEIAGLRPRVVLYFSGTPDAIYQINTWLDVVERLDQQVLIVLRERANLPLLGRTSLPVVCIPGASDLMDFRLPTVRVAFYVAHVGKNIHLMREPRMKHVFIGHGESDKVASVNPVTKGFDEVWVAGRASRERWAAAKVGVRDEAIVEVGRPQLGGIRPAEPRRDGVPLSVLYAPTWEGWTSDVLSTSLTTMGPSLVAWLLKRPGTRLIYKPHPFTGTVSPAARRAHAQILGLLERHPGFGRLAVAGARATEAEWAAVADRHLVISGPVPGLYDCFNHSDMLIGDISSVIPDYVASGKPYFIPNPGERDHDAIRAEYASARAAYLLDPKSAGWAELFEAAAGPDPLREQRQQLRLDLLGPYYPDPVQPWREALTSLIDRADAEWPDAEQESLRFED